MREDSTNKTILVIVISVISVILIAFMILGAYFLITRNTFGSVESANPPIVNITSCPEQVNSDNPNVTIEGFMINEAPYCTLSINGEVVATSTTKGMQTYWSKTYTLSAGETREFNIEAKDSNNLITVKRKTVYCQELNTKKNRAPISPGCTLVKKKSGGLNIRKYAGTSYSVVDYINGSDYTSEMVFTGHYEVDYQGYTWYEVVSPKGKHGYVRSDLVQTNTFVD